MLFAPGKYCNLSVHSLRHKTKGPCLHSFVDTPIIAEGVQSGGLKPEFEKTPLGRAANVDEITDSILFLASPTSSFMCGAGLVVDGGYSI